MSQAVLKMQETNRFLILKNKWWKEKRGGGACKDDGSAASAASELGLANVGGVFAVLIGGMVTATFVSLCEFVWETRRAAISEGKDVVEEMKNELRFALKCSGNTKPVKKESS